MAKSMTAALAIPHLGLCDQVDLSRLVALRAELKAEARGHGVNLSYMPFFIKVGSVSSSRPVRVAESRVPRAPTLVVSPMSLAS